MRLNLICNFAQKLADMPYFEHLFREDHFQNGTLILKNETDKIEILDIVLADMRGRPVIFIELEHLPIETDINLDLFIFLHEDHFNPILVEVEKESIRRFSILHNLRE